MTGPALIVHVIYRLDLGGLENGLVNVINLLPEDRFRHAVVCLTDFTDFRRRIRRDDVPVLALYKRPGKDPGLYFRMWKLIRQLRPDILHTRNLATVDMQWVGWAAGVPRRVHGEHGWSAHDPQGLDPRTLRIRQACRPVVHRWMAMSRDMERWLLKDVGAPADRVRQLYNGVDAERFSPEGVTVSDAPWLPSPDAITLGTAGRLDPIKNQGWLLTAFHSILERNPGFRGRLRLIIGGDGPMRVELQRSAERLGIADQVWLPGARSDMPALMRSLDVFVLPSLNEGISNAILEAMACARPVVAARVGGNAELVEQDVTGMLYQPGDFEGFERAVRLYAESPARRSEHGRTARQRVVADFSLESMIRRYADFYDELLANRS